MNYLNTYLCFNIRVAMRKIDKKMTAKLAAANISLPQFFVLLYLQEENGLTLKQIRQKIMIDSSSMTMLIDNLENNGLVERQTDSKDRRVIRVFITAGGSEVAIKTAAICADFNDYLFDVVGEENQKELAHALNNIINKI